MSKNIDWSSLGFGYIQTDKRFVSNYKDGAWDDGVLTTDANIVMRTEAIQTLPTHMTPFK